jgi:prephenate dehydratase
LPGQWLVFFVSGNKAGAKLELEKSMARSLTQSPYNLAKVYVALNDNDKALTELEKAYQARDIWMYNFYVDPVFDPIRSEPRFKAILKKMNLE